MKQYVVSESEVDLLLTRARQLNIEYEILENLDLERNKK